MLCWVADGEMKGEMAMRRVNSYVKRELQRINGNIKQRNADELAKRLHRKNIEDLLSFTSNLFTVLGDTGVSLPGDRKNSCPSLKFKTSIKDYKGSIAGHMFSARFPSNAMQNKRGIRTFK